MANGYGIGGFASGLAEGLRTGQETRLRQELIRKRKRENRREKAIDDVRGEIADSTGEGALTTPQRALQGPTPNGEQLMSVDGAKRIQSMLTQAMLTGDENSINAVKDMGRRTAMFHVMKARQAQDPEEELASLNEAGRVIGLGDASFSRDKQGNLLDPFGNTVTPDRRPALYNYIAQQFNDPANAARMYGEDMRMERAGEREDAFLSLAEEESAQRWATIFNNNHWKGRDAAAREREFKESIRQFDKTYELEYKKANDYGKYLLSRVGLNEAEAAAYKTPPAWEDPTDALKAVENNNAQVMASTLPYNEYAASMNTDPEVLRQQVAFHSSDAIVEHGVSARATAEEGALAVIGYLKNSSDITVTDHFRDSETGRHYIQDANGKLLPVSSNMYNLVDNAYKSRLEASDAAAGRTALPLGEDPLSTSGMGGGMTREQRTVNKGFTPSADVLQEFYNSNPSIQALTEGFLDGTGL